MKRWIERALNIHPGDLGRGTLLCACLFLVISTYKIGGVAGAALFLSRFQARQLAYVDISSALLVAMIVAGYVLIARRVPLLGLLVGSMLFFASNCALLWFLAHYYSRLTKRLEDYSDNNFSSSRKAPTLTILCFRVVGNPETIPGTCVLR